MSANYKALKPVIYELNFYSTIDLNHHQKNKKHGYKLKLAALNITLMIIIIFLLKQLDNKTDDIKQHLPINITNLLIDKTNACQESEGRYARLITLIFSDAANIEARVSIRLSWGKKAMAMGFFYFILDPSYNKQVQQNLELESGTYEDILQLNITKDNDSVLFKTLIMLQWLRERCGQVDYILRADDNMLVDIYDLDDFLKQEPDLENIAAIVGDRHTRWQSEIMGWWWTNLWYRWWSLKSPFESYIDSPYIFTGKAIEPFMDIVKTTFLGTKNQQKQCETFGVWEMSTLLAHQVNLTLLLYPNLIKLSSHDTNEFATANNVSQARHLLISRAQSPEHLLELARNYSQT